MIMHSTHMHQNTHKTTFLCVIDSFVVFLQSLPYCKSLDSFLKFIKIPNQMNYLFWIIFMNVFPEWIQTSKGRN